MSLINFIKQSCIEYTSPCAGIELDTLMGTVMMTKAVRPPLSLQNCILLNTLHHRRNIIIWVC